MGLGRDIASIRRRLNEIAPMVQQPELKIQVINASEPVLAHTVWKIVVRVEDKDTVFI